MIFPEELWQAIVEHLVYDIRFFEQQFPQLRWNYPVAQLIPLSLVSRQLRRICLPVMFAYVETNTKDTGRLKDHCIANQALAMSIRVLSIQEYRQLNFLDWPHEEKKFALIDLLPRLNNLLQLNLKNIFVGKLLLAAINNHTLPTIVVDLAWFGPAQGSFNLSKISLEVEDVSTNYERLFERLERYLSRGLQVTKLTVQSDRILAYALPKFTNLTEFGLVLHRQAVTVAWLVNLARSHPLLQKVTFTLSGVGRYLFRHETSIPYLHSFCERMRSSAVRKMTAVPSFALTRANNSVTSAAPSAMWVVTGLSLYVHDMSSAPVLQLVRSELPHISTLTIHHGQPSRGYHALPFVISLIQMFGYLDFGAKLVQQPGDFISFQVRPVIMQYASRLACEIPSIETFFISEKDDESSSRLNTSVWYIKGWSSGDELRHNGAKSEFYRVPELMTRDYVTERKEVVVPLNLEHLGSQYYTKSHRISATGTIRLVVWDTDDWVMTAKWYRN
ncbi:hypothetical protein BDP27DRAFT_1403780 [Rhodocollybia butyracea]|uniref:Uncharacterized protein n=1 Tax=Rhodocollybia butyracea TaxID=206335 RepID=A0A9P5U672_9AGAR|nr:hypothetical protein BDP27DRAFT_1403780 [Rhodocollybia butyracea]